MLRVLIGGRANGERQSAPEHLTLSMHPSKGKERMDRFWNPIRSMVMIAFAGLLFGAFTAYTAQPLAASEEEEAEAGIGHPHNIDGLTWCHCGADGRCTPCSWDPPEGGATLQ
jgi:hypothetical protein